MPSAFNEPVFRIIASAKELPVAERDAYLVLSCDGDEKLLSKLRLIMSSADAIRIDMDKTDISDRGKPAPPASRSMSERTTIDFSDPDKLVGQTLDGRFRIEKNLTDKGGDTGGIGVVYLAKDIKLMNKDVVVKILNETALQHPDIVRKFDHEKEALIRLDHPNIVRILDSGNLSDGNPFMVMDYIKGHSLRKAIQLAEKLPLEVVANIVESVSDALSAAHSEKILHRDIKPENIMLTPIEEGQYRVRVIDFGIARVEESKLAPVTEISRAIGSVHYIAPEQLIGRLDLTPAADIYSLAIVTYEMLTGELPFKPKTLTEMYQLESAGVQVRPGQLRPDMPREAERILLTAFEFEPEKRPQNARAFGRYLAHELKIDGQETDRFYASIKTEFHSSPTQAIPAPDPTDFVTVQRSEEPTFVDKVLGAAKWAVPTAIMIAAVAVTVAYFAWNASRPNVPETVPVANTIPTETGSERSLNYYLTVQKMRNGKTFESAFKSSGAETIETGYKFTMTFVPDADGYMYVYNHGKDKDGKLGYSIWFPTPSVNNGISKVSASQVVETFSSEAKGTRGTEVIWLIWTKDPIFELERVYKAAFDTAGTLSSENQAILASFLDKTRSSKPVAEKDTVNQQTIIRARGDEVVHRFELEHR